MTMNQMKTPSRAILIAALVGTTVSGMAQTMEPTPAAAAHTVVAPGAKLETLAHEFKFTEGPSCDAQGNVFFTDQPNDRIMKWSTDGKLSTFKQPAGRANGMQFDAQGNLIACADEKTELWSIAPDGKVTVLLKEFDGKKLNGPNDVWIRPDGGMYLTDPFYRRSWWDYKDQPQDSQCVYFLSADRKTFKRVVTDYQQPNGIIGTPDGKYVYIADIKAGKTYRFNVEADGSLTGKRLICKMGSDGMTIDNDGNIYISGKGIFVFNKNGQQIDHIDVPEKWAANVCFGGKDRQTLFITASEGLYAIRMRVKGWNAAK
jgi:gluconolactonase